MRPESVLPANAPPGRVDGRRQRIEPAQEDDDCHMVESGTSPPHAAMPEYRTPRVTIQYNCQSGFRGGVRGRSKR